eukprot:TRINITY_DN64981_c0_g1_i1.p1 TRINITY_DN64981_c0_g1~~TRINITY_DN64981_c0_g1_i1.p1  ORF type:complete len:467 (-),score=34.77 TRINITY_DN64981_c0_g1_i1:1860-3260(-)
MENQKSIIGLRTSWYLFHCIGLSIVYLGSGFIYAFVRNLLPDSSKTSLQLGSTASYCLGALLCGYFIGYGRRLTLMISDIACVALIPLLFIGSQTIDLIAYCTTPFFEGWWAVGVFVYGKDLSVVHQPAFIAIFAQIMNSIGVTLGDALQFSGQYWDLDESTEKMYVRICVCAGLLTPCIIQLVLFMTYMKKEPIRYEFEKSGEEYVYDSLNELFTDKQSIQKIVNALKRFESYKKFVGIKYMTLLSKYYRKAFLTCLALFAFKGSTYLLSFYNRIAEGISEDVFNGYLLLHSTIKTVLMVGALFLINLIQRKSLLFLGYTFFVSTNLINFFLSFAYATQNTRTSALVYMIGITVSEYFSFAFLSYVPYVFALELLPDKGVAFIIAFYSIYTCLLKYSTISFGDSLNMKCIYYATITLIGVAALAFVHYLVKYTEGNTEEGAKKAYLEENENMISNEQFYLVWTLY